MNELGAFLQNQPQFFGGFHFQPQNSNLITDLKSLQQNYLNYEVEIQQKICIESLLKMQVLKQNNVGQTKCREAVAGTELTVKYNGHAETLEIPSK